MSSHVRSPSKTPLCTQEIMIAKKIVLLKNGFEFTEAPWKRFRDLQSFLEHTSGTTFHLPRNGISVFYVMYLFSFTWCQFFFSKVILSNVYWHQQYRANIFPLLSLLFCVSWVIKSMCQDILGKYLWNIKEKEKEGERQPLDIDAGLALVKQRGKRGLGRKSLRSQHSLKNASARMMGNPQASDQRFLPVTGMSLP